MFFLTKEAIPEGVGFSTFGLTHLIWLVSLSILGLILIVTYRKLDTNKRNVMRIVVGLIVVFHEIFRDIGVIAVDKFTFADLPLHLCGINILLVGFDLIKKTDIVRNFLYYFSIPGALLALLFPNWTMLPCMNYFHINSFGVHAFLVIYPLMLVISGEVQPKIEIMPKCIILLVCMAIPIYIVNLLCDTNFMFLMEPETGNPLGLFEKYLGNHLWGFPILLPVVMFAMYLPLFFASKCQKSTNIETEKKEKQLIN